MGSKPFRRFPQTGRQTRSGKIRRNPRQTRMEEPPPTCDNARDEPHTAQYKSTPRAACYLIIVTVRPPYLKDDISRDNSARAGSEIREILESSDRDFSAFAIASRASEIREEMPLPSRDRARPSMRSAA